MNKKCGKGMKYLKEMRKSVDSIGSLHIFRPQQHAGFTVFECGMFPIHQPDTRKIRSNDLRVRPLKAKRRNKKRDKKQPRRPFQILHWYAKLDLRWIILGPSKAQQPKASLVCSSSN